ncbi:MAG TPA: flagellar motor protein MotB [Bryobacteraceae bacterium]|nr:flagellar motor protein MotB [Bryobacteraceae bacterium]
MRRVRQSGPSHERWLVSYADFITLLFAFFVVMFATAQTDVAKQRAVSESVSRALQGDSFKQAFSMLMGGVRDGKNPGMVKQADAGKKIATGDNQGLTLAELLPILSEALQQEIASGRLALQMTSRGLTISFTQTALFPSGEDEIAPDFDQTIQKIALAMNKVRNPARAEGHTDSVPIHNSRFRSNWELSAARSIALVERLTAYGVARERLSISGYADTAPIDNNDTEDGRRKNRRVDIVLLNETAAKGEPEKAPVPVAKR